jgi:hypothetical protein
MRAWIGLLLWPGFAQAAPVRMDHAGRAVDAGGTPLNGTHTVRVTLYGDAAGTVALFRQTFPSIPMAGGHYAVTLSTADTSGTPLDSSLFAGDVWLGVAYDGGADLAPLEPISSVPKAAFASHVDGTVRATTPSAACVAGNTATHGLLRYDPTTLSLQVCSVGGWSSIVSTKTIQLVSGARQWSNGTYATTCEAYRTATGLGEFYLGDVGNGAYRIDPDGSGPGAVQTVTCDMTTGTGGWLVLADHNYSTGTACPGTLVAVAAGSSVNTTLCWRNVASTSGGTKSASFSPPYPVDEVNVKLTGHQWYSMDAFGSKSGASIDAIYVDGASLTRGSPRQHLYTWAVGLSSGTTEINNCPANSGSSGPAFMGSNWACQTGNTTTHTNTWYAPELFSAVNPTLLLGSATTDTFELRVMSDQESLGNEDLGLRTFKLLVR